jgi:hypothetical protein
MNFELTFVIMIVYVVNYSLAFIHIAWYMAAINTEFANFALVQGILHFHACTNFLFHERFIFKKSCPILQHLMIFVLGTLKFANFSLVLSKSACY